MFECLRISETAKAIIWLWNNDNVLNWRIGTHAIVHEPTGIGVWTANENYGLSLYVDIPVSDRKRAHPCNGRNMKLNKRDRNAIHKAIVLNASKFAHQRIQKQISDWAADEIRSDNTEDTQLTYRVD